MATGRIVILLAAAWLSRACVGGAPRVVLGAAEVQFLCAVEAEHRDRLGRNEDDATLSPVKAQLERLVAVKPVPRAILCPSGEVRLAVEGVGESAIYGVGLSADGRIAAMAGGWSMLPVQKGDGTCYFERREGGWHLIGCHSAVAMW